MTILTPKDAPVPVNDVKVVVFHKDDPEDPKNWANSRKVTVVCLLCALSFCA